MSRRTPTDATDPAVSGPICGKVEARDDDRHYVCIRNPGHLGACNPVPADREAVKRLAERGAPEGGFFDVPESPTDVLAMATPSRPETLPAVPPGGVQAADPAQPTPDVATTSEPSGETTASPAGSGGGSGRSLVRPDAGESVLAALGGVYNPAAEPGYAIRLAEDFARLMVMGPHFASLVQANADKQPPEPKDVRALYRKLRQIAATHAIDLTDEGAGS